MGLGLGVGLGLELGLGLGLGVGLGLELRLFVLGLSRVRVRVRLKHLNVTYQLCCEADDFNYFHCASCELYIALFMGPLPVRGSDHVHTLTMTLFQSGYVSNQSTTECTAPNQTRPSVKTQQGLTPSGAVALN